MKKNFFILIILTIFFFIFPSYIDASYDAMISGDTVRIRSGAGTENSVLYVVNSGTSISVVDKTLYEGTDCPKKWYKITYKEKTGYVCSRYVKFVDNTPLPRRRKQHHRHRRFAPHNTSLVNKNRYYGYIAKFAQIRCQRRGLKYAQRISPKKNRC